MVGLNQNADLTFRLQEASGFFDTILETQVGSRVQLNSVSKKREKSY